MPRLVLVVLLVTPAAALPAQHPELERIAWLVGCWERTTTANRRAVEKWFPPRDGVLHGTSQVIADGAARETEALRIFISGGTLIYEAHPASQARTPFAARETTSSTAVFANPEHDYPQQITYTLSGDSLAARIEGDHAGRRGPQTFRFRRAQCPEVQLTPATLARLALEPKYDEIERAEARLLGAQYEWFADQAAPGYGLARWSTPGSQVMVRGDSALRRLAQAMRESNTQFRQIERRLDVTLDRVLVRGDTAETLVTSRLMRRFADDSARIGVAGAEHQGGAVQRWLDVWVRAGEDWKLTWTRVVFEEVSLDEKVTVRDGQPVR